MQTLRNFILLICFFPNVLMSLAFTSVQNYSDKNIVFQPQFKYADHTSTQHGTGSFIRAPTGEIIGLTSAHFIDFSGPPLLEAQWLDVKTNKPVITFVKSWGMPGHEGSYDPLDLRSDYILMVAEGKIDSQNILELDPRSGVERGERIWFPNKNIKSHLGYDLIEGKVSEAKDTHIEITLDQIVDLKSRSGTPIISQRSGKVIGILTGSERKEDALLIYLAPGHNIYKTLNEVQQCPLLQDVVGYRIKK